MCVANAVVLVDLDRCFCGRVGNVFALLDMVQYHSFRLHSLHPVCEDLQHWRKEGGTSRPGWQMVLTTLAHSPHILLVFFLLVLSRLVIINDLLFGRTFWPNGLLHEHTVDWTEHSLLNTNSFVAAGSSFESFEWVVGLNQSHILWEKGGFLLF